MPPIHMTRDERSSLARLAESATPLSELPPGHTEKLVSHGLAVCDSMRVQITPKGQLELFRQRFRKQTTRRRRHPMNGLVLGDTLIAALPDGINAPAAANDDFDEDDADGTDPSPDAG